MSFTIHWCGLCVRFEEQGRVRREGGASELLSSTEGPWI
jgi:hypothetical protein